MNVRAEVTPAHPKLGPAEASRPVYFLETVVTSASSFAQNYAPDNSADAIIFDDLKAEAQGSGTVGASIAAVAIKIKGDPRGSRLKIDVRGSCTLTAGARGVLTILDGNVSHQTNYSNTGREVFMSWSRSLKKDEIIQISLWATCRASAAEDSAALMQIDSIDLVLNQGRQVGKKKKSN